MEQISLIVYGEPAPQGSKRIIKGRLVEASSAKLRKWRKAIADTCLGHADQNIILGPVHVEANFYLTRPQSVKFNKRPLPIVPPDLDKLCRGLLDGIGQSQVIWGDDSQVVSLTARKYYADQHEPGAEVVIRSL